MNQEQKDKLSRADDSVNEVLQELTNWLNDNANFEKTERHTEIKSKKEKLCEIIDLFDKVINE